MQFEKIYDEDNMDTGKTDIFDSIYVIKLVLFLSKNADVLCRKNGLCG